MIYFFGAIAVGLILWQIRDTLFNREDWVWLVGEAPLEELLEFPLSGDWSHDDVIKTYAEIQSL